MQWDNNCRVFALDPAGAGERGLAWYVAVGPVAVGCILLLVLGAA